MNQNITQIQNNSQQNDNDFFLSNVLTRLSMIALLLFCIIGIYMFPAWWYEFFFRAGFLSGYVWQAGINYLIKFGLNWIILVCMICLLLMVLVRKTNYLNSLKPPFVKVQRWVEGKLGVSIIAILVGIFFISLISLQSWGIINYVRRIVDYYPLSNESTNVFDQSFNKNSNPLTKPTTFIYIAKNEVESLYSQYESELTPSKVTEEVIDSTTLKAELSVKELLSTEAGKDWLQKKIKEYQQITKTPERKLTDLLHYLYNDGKLKQLTNLESNSDDIVELNNAVQVLNNKHKLTLDQNQIKSIREKLMSQELGQFKVDLGNLSGNILVKGGWTIEDQAQSQNYLLKHVLVEGIGNSPICAVNLPKTNVQTQYKDEIKISTSNRKPIKLSVFGTVITNDSSTIWINPIAIFLPDEL
ncbi:hypothetical protein A6770_38755 [Nostoc minutum NIES-26]|uniref:Uncharacterized protein n=1 Tax=Nostoc minutum NIES-26 TaxID=1844469 RepID=A0A367RWI3_9NOSO|nr:hypothetical protein A6770_38755 [Nostoc minutum NIES-26]